MSNFAPSSFSGDRDKGNGQDKHSPAHMRWPHRQADQVRGLSLREIGGGFARHHRAPSIRAACYTIAKPSTMVQKMQNVKRVRGHRNAVYCGMGFTAKFYVIRLCSLCSHPRENSQAIYVKFSLMFVDLYLKLP